MCIFYQNQLINIAKILIFSRIFDDIDILIRKDKKFFKRLNKSLMKPYCKIPRLRFKN